MADVVAGLDLSRITVRICAAGESLLGFLSYEELLAEQSGESLLDEREGQEMLYSGGTTGRPKGSANRCPRRRSITRRR